MDKEPSTIGEALVAKGIITELQHRTAIDVHRRAGGELGDIIAGLAYTSEDHVARCRASWLDLPYVDLARVAIDRNLLHGVSKLYLFQYSALPIERRADGKVFVVVANPNSSLPIFRRFEEAFQATTTVGIGSKSAIVDRLTRLFGPDLPNR